MIWTIQLFSDSGSIADPEPTDVQICRSAKDCGATLLDFAEESRWVGAEPEQAYARVWRGRIKDTTDEYPDFELRVGPRGGVRWSPC